MIGEVGEIATEYRNGDITIAEMAEKLADNWVPTQRQPYPEETDADLEGVNQSTIFLLTDDERAAFNAEMARRRGDAYFAVESAEFVHRRPTGPQTP